MSGEGGGGPDDGVDIRQCQGEPGGRQRAHPAGQAAPVGPGKQVPAGTNTPCPGDGHVRGKVMSGARSCLGEGHVRGTVMSGGRSCLGDGERVNIQCVEYRKLDCWNYQSCSLCEISLGRGS